jgi:formiminoglutamase
VSAPLPIGLTAEQAAQVVEFLTIYKDTKLLEITEVNPKFDIDGRTAKLAAILLHRFISRTIEKTP